LVTHPFVIKRRRRLLPADVAEADDCNDYNEPEPEQTELEEWLDGVATQVTELEPETETAVPVVEPFDWNAAELQRAQ
jgi:hypothetical protein